jgi:hypothetical protein
LKPGERVVDLGSGDGFDCFITPVRSGLKAASWAAT